jgi:hypothetical protein
VKTSFSLGLAVVLAVAAVAAELVIVSLDRHGELTWTNSVSNATYRVEWASSVAGPWQKFDALTNLTLLSATGNLVSVKVPMFYRVVWLDAPPWAGTYRYSGWDDQGVLVVTGRLVLYATQQRPQCYDGSWELVRVDGRTNEIGPQVGKGNAAGSVTESGIWLDFIPDIDDVNLTAEGNFIGNTCLGYWYWYDYSGNPVAQGFFRAVKENAIAELPPANPAGVWDYQALDFALRLVVTGELSFATSTNPISGEWLLGITSLFSTTHPVGQGAFAGGVFSGNSITVAFDEPADRSFTLEGEWAGDRYAGFWRRAGPEGGERGIFQAKRRTNP